MRVGLFICKCLCVYILICYFQLSNYKNCIYDIQSTEDRMGTRSSDWPTKKVNIITIGYIDKGYSVGTMR